MSSKTLEGMARAHWTSFADIEPKSSVIDLDDIEAMRAALLWLADNVSDEMAEAAMIVWDEEASCDEHRPAAKAAISAALRAAAGDGK